LPIARTTRPLPADGSSGPARSRNSPRRAASPGGGRRPADGGVGEAGELGRDPLQRPGAAEVGQRHEQGDPPARAPQAGHQPDPVGPVDGGDLGREQPGGSVGAAGQQQARDVRLGQEGLGQERAAGEDAVQDRGQGRVSLDGGDDLAGGPLPQRPPAPPAAFRRFRVGGAGRGEGAGRQGPRGPSPEAGEAAEWEPGDRRSSRAVPGTAATAAFGRGLMRLSAKILRVLGLLALLLLLAAVALALRLAEGPIPLGSVAGFATRAIERAGPFKVSFKEPALAWSREQGTLLFEVRDLYVTTETGRFVAAAPAVGLRLDAASLVRGRQVRIREAEVRLPELQLTRGRDKALVLSFGDRLGALPLRDATGGGLLRMLAGGAPEAGDKRLESLRRIRVEAEGLRFVDEPSGRVVDSGRARLRITRAEAADGWEVRLDAATFGGAAGSRVRLAVAPVAGSATLQDVGVELVRVPVKALDGLLPELDLGEVELPVSGELRATLDPATRTPGPGRFSLTTDGGRVGLPGLLPGPVEIRGATFAGEAGQGWREVAVTAGEVRLPEATARLSGGLSPRRGGEGAAAVARRRPARRAAPDAALAAAARTRGAGWVAANVAAGRVTRASLELRRPTGTAEPRPPLGYVLDFAFAEAAARFLPDWPAAEIAAGTGHLEPDRFTLDLGPARVGGAEARKAVVTLTRLRSPEPTLLDVALDGAEAPVPAVLDLLARKPLELTQKLGFDPKTTRGRFRGSVGLTLPLAGQVGPNDVRKRAKGTLGDLGARQVRPGYDVTGGDLRLDLDDERLELTGEVALNRVPARVTWRERLKPGPERRRIDVAATLDREKAVALNAGWLEGLEGALPVEAVVSEADRRPRRIDVKADLAPLRLAFPQFMLAKGKGEPGRLEARLEQPDERRINIVDGTATWSGVSLRAGGDLRLGPFEWRRFDLRDVRTPRRS
jgi:hypothetical protein